MKRILPWMGLGLLAAAVAGTTFSCGGDSGGGNGGGNMDGGKGANGGSGGALDGSAGGGGGRVATGGGGGGEGGAGGSGGSSQRLGRACAADAECGQGLTCEKPGGGNWDGEGPAKGYCTADCSADPNVCQPFDSTASCLTLTNGKAFCVESC